MTETVARVGGSPKLSPLVAQQMAAVLARGRLTAHQIDLAAMTVCYPDWDWRLIAVPGGVTLHAFGAGKRKPLTQITHV